ncbi:P-loop containing nucleoside triphosphate hydrolase protein [Phellopilus nigrolimitatus]|nr:P-loop containing nucleoside triphosphate hydrolase protein [Phellopilus nigrolimitatus]
MTQRLVAHERAPQAVRVAADAYAEYAFTLHRMSQEGEEYKAYFDIRSPYLRDVSAEVIGKIDYKTFLMFLPELQACSDRLSSKPELEKSESDTLTHAHLSFFLSFLRLEYAATLSELAALLAHDEITFDLLWTIMRPRTLLYAKCKATGAPRAVRLLDASVVSLCGTLVWQLKVEYVEYNVQHGTLSTTAHPGVETTTSFPKFGIATGFVVDAIHHFKGAVKITSLATYPFHYFSRVQELTEMLIARGRKWEALQGGLHHMQYNGPGLMLKNGSKITARTPHIFGAADANEEHVNSRIMIDRESFVTAAAAAQRNTLPEVKKTLDGRLLENVTAASLPDAHLTASGESELSESDLLVANPCVYGFSLSAKLWVTLGVAHVSPIEWNDEPFANLILSGNQKAVVKALVETHTADAAKAASQQFDDFVRGKGRGLVINLFGNPGVGKTLTAEATSEQVRRPLYVVGAADLGASAGSVEEELKSALGFAERWGAVVLIDEADVFLEERSLHDLARNAMVSVFLRHLEYFCGILFLTTNRVRTFDDAFQSRIHVSLRYHDLSSDAKRQIWIAFLAKARTARIGDAASGERSRDTAPGSGFSEEELSMLTERKVNGRQIKNAVRTASALASSAREPLSYQHLAQVLDMMADFALDMNTA